MVNLGFGDVEASGEVNDTVVTDNKDGERVFATVAMATLRFFEAYPDSIVYIIGSTPSRTRLYQMRIARHLEEVRNEFKVIGFSNDAWHTFDKGLNFQSFLVSKRK